MTKIIDPETCSWCVTECEWSDLTETSEGNLCPECVQVAKDNGSVLIIGRV